MATGFFEKAGYKAKLEQGGQNQCSFRLGAPDSHERLGHRLQTYLKSKYAVTVEKLDAAEINILLAKQAE